MREVQEGRRLTKYEDTAEMRANREFDPMSTAGESPPRAVITAKLRTAEIVERPWPIGAAMRVRFRRFAPCTVRSGEKAIDRLQHAGPTAFGA
jgi:hypothetical protein